MSAYDKLRVVTKHLTTEERQPKRIGDSRSAKERKQNTSALQLQIPRSGK